MVESLSIYELKELYDKKRPSRICFATDDQGWNDPFDSLRLELAFQNIVIIKHPSLIYLTNGKNQLCLNQVKRIEREMLAGNGGEILTVYCLDRVGSDISYCFWVSY